jgi:hypothetical protein
MDYAYKENGKFVWPVAMSSRFNGVGGFHTLTDAQRAKQEFYPIQYTNNIFDSKTQERSLASVKLVNNVLSIEYSIVDIPLITLQEKAKQTIGEIKLRRAFDGVEFSVNGNSHIFGKDYSDINKIHGVALDIKAGLLSYSDVGGYWKSKTGERVAMSESDFLLMSNAITVFLLKNEQAAHDAKDDIDEAVSADLINVIIKDYETLTI